MHEDSSVDKKKLEFRIRVHEKYSKYDINEWIFNIIKIKGDESILDVGCGTGKQLIPITEKTRGLVVGVDISKESLDYTKGALKNKNSNVKLILSSIEGMYDLLKNFPNFDIIISCFAIYYSKDPKETLLRFKKLLKYNGRVFLCGPSVNNNKALLELHGKVKELPKMHKGFFENFAIKFLRRNFKKVEIYKFQNPVTFPDVESLAQYWLSYSIGDRNKLSKFKRVAQEHFRDGAFTTVKEVVGVLAVK